ncbi:protein slit-like [Lethenteron reissneri]|uniref:protein slit-like n=1 Tax=Lethenteron reissneri TaxID=7753 RepID=UPI002AB6BBA5|nr:protein slit-like [Lethenteron reissneri]XP_061413783.1 protein slit-like [Lethenteron reissneri]
MKLTSPSSFVSHLSPHLAFSITIIITTTIVPSASSANCDPLNISSSSPPPASSTATCFEATGSNCPLGPSLNWDVLVSLTSASAEILKIDCKLKSVEVSEGQPFPMLPNLNELRLNNNQLQNLPTGFMGNHKSLKVLHLEDNHLTILPMAFLKGCVSMEKLLLHNNMLMHLPSFIKLPLKSLTLHNNLLVCDCSLYLMLRHKTTLLVPTDYAPEFPKCHSPVQLKGEPVKNVSMDMVCRDVGPYFSKLYVVPMAAGAALFLVVSAVAIAGMWMARKHSYNHRRVSNNAPISNITVGTSFATSNTVNNAYITTAELSSPYVPEDVYDNVGEMIEEDMESDNYIDGDINYDDKDDYENL